MHRLTGKPAIAPAQASTMSRAVGHNRLEFSVLAAGTGLAALLVVLTAFGIWRSHDEAIVNAKLDTMNLARVIATNADQGIRAIDLNLETTEEVFRNWPTGRAIPDKQLTWLLNGRLKLMPHVRTLFILNRDGIMTHAAASHTPRLNTSLADREYFSWHREHPAGGVHVGAPILSRGLNTLYIPVTRRLNAPGGSFDGVIAAAFEPVFLRRFYSSINTGKHGLVAIYLRDGTLLARAPHIDGLIGKKLTGARLFGEYLPIANEGSYQGITISDGTPRIFSYVAYPDAGLVTVVGFADEDVLIEWRHHATRDIAKMAMFLTALATMTFLLMRQLRKQGALTENLAKSEAEYRHIVGTANEGIWQIDTLHRTTFVNPRITGMLGYSEAELLGKPPGDFVIEEDLPRDHAMLEQRLATDAPAQYDLRYRRKDGTILWTITSVSSTFDDHGNSTGALAMLTDITERAKVEAEVRHHLTSLEALRAMDKAILDAQSSEAIAATGLQYLRQLVPYWGATVMAFDHAANEAIVLNMTRAVGSNYDPGARLTLEEYGLGDIAVLKTGRECVVADMDADPERSSVLQSLYNKGMRAYVRVPLLAEGELVGVINLGNDHTGTYTPEQIAVTRSIAEVMAIALRQAALREQVADQAVNLERRVAERTAQLDELNRELESFTSSVSHDLRAPVRHIDGFTSMLLEDAKGLDESSVGMLHRIARSARNMDALIDDLLSLARIGAREMLRVRVDMNALVREVIDELTRHQARPIEWKIANLPVASGDPALVRVLLQNLLTNAVKYSSKRERPLIEIGARTGESGETVYFVRDNGAGFDMTYVGKLFKVCSRLHLEKDFDGTGIGLVTVQRVVSRHGGYVRAMGKVDEGAEFSFTLGAT